MCMIIINFLDLLYRGPVVLIHSFVLVKSKRGKIFVQRGYDLQILICEHSIYFICHKKMKNKIKIDSCSVSTKGVLARNDDMHL